MRIREPLGPWIRGPGWKNFRSGIRDKRPVSATLVTLRQPRSMEVKYLVVEPHPRGEDPVDGLPRDPRPAPVLVLVVVVRVGGAQRLHLRLLPFAAHHKLYILAASKKNYIFLILILSESLNYIKQCWGSVAFWYGSGCGS